MQRFFYVYRTWLMFSICWVTLYKNFIDKRDFFRCSLVWRSFTILHISSTDKKPASDHIYSETLQMSSMRRDLSKSHRETFHRYSKEKTLSTPLLSTEYRPQDFYGQNHFQRTFIVRSLFSQVFNGYNLFTYLYHTSSTKENLPQGFLIKVLLPRSELIF